MRVRFAPSPTGNLHIGSVRTALFNWLFAQHEKGKLILRIEDTDQERSQKVFEEDILSGLKWLGLHWDEGPYYQTTQRELYLKTARSLLDKKLAYEKEGAIFFRVPQTQSILVNDCVRGEVQFESQFIQDQVLIKSDGFPTYNFAVVVDDHAMGITHVIRGEDHLPNTPKQILLYDALGYDLPSFAHIPMILGPDRSKLSKRHGATSVNQYRAQGFLPDAMINYLSLLGWTPSDGSEVMSIEELIQKFSLDRVAKAGAIFDIEKLRWMNSIKLKSVDAKTLITWCQPYLSSLPHRLKGRSSEQTRLFFTQMIESVRDSLHVLQDITLAVEVYYEESIHWDARMKPLQDTEALVLNLCLEKLMRLTDDFSSDQGQQLLDELLSETRLSKKKILHPLRYVLTARESGPPMKYVLSLLGKSICMKRLEEFMSRHG